MHAVSSSSPPPPPSSSSSPAAPALPHAFGRYTLFELVGKGGMAQIYLARAETELGATRLSVLKQILPTFADDPRFAEMLIHEAKLAARLSHKHIVQVFDLGREAEHLYIAMEYVEGFDLNALLKMCTEKKVGLPAQHALGIVVDVLEGLDYAHRQKDDEGKPLGIVHRDVSPSNILISYEGEVKLCDFGIAHANDLVKTDDASEALKGKAGYMSPEHANGETLDARADVFAAGIILWELLSGRRLYKPRGDVSLLDQARAAEIPPVADKGLPEHARLQAIVDKALAKNRDERFASAAAFQRELEGYLAETGMLASRLELGKWIASTFGTELVEQRRASERKLPKSSPPRSSSSMRARGVDGATSSVMPAATRTSRPPSSTRTVAGHVIPVSDGAIRAFKREVEDAAATPRPMIEDPIRVTVEPESLAGSSIDVPGSSSTALDARATGRDSVADAREKKLARRGPVPLAVVFVLLAIVALIALARVLVQ